MSVLDVNDDLLEILACPKCHGKVTMAADGVGFDCAACRLRYLVVDGIPNFLVDEAETLDDPAGSSA